MEKFSDRWNELLDTDTMKELPRPLLEIIEWAFYGGAIAFLATIINQNERNGKVDLEKFAQILALEVVEEGKHTLDNVSINIEKICLLEKYIELVEKIAKDENSPYWTDAVMLRHQMKR